LWPQPWPGSLAFTGLNLVSTACDNPGRASYSPIKSSFVSI